jgi:hypothetical protein
LIIRGDGLAPPFQPASFDFVLASQLLHHFTEEKIVTLLRTWSQLARRAIIVSDLVRHPVAYHGIRLITKICTRNVMTRTDAPLSVRRAFTMAEWRELFRRAEVGRLQIFPIFPYRMLALISLNPNPKKLSPSAVSEDGGTGSRGHLSAQLAQRPRRRKYHPQGNAGGLQGTVPLPTAAGLAGLASSK